MSIHNNEYFLADFAEFVIILNLLPSERLHAQLVGVPKMLPN